MKKPKRELCDYEDIVDVVNSLCGENCDTPWAKIMCAPESEAIIKELTEMVRRDEIHPLGYLCHCYEEINKKNQQNQQQ